MSQSLTCNQLHLQQFSTKYLLVLRAIVGLSRGTYVLSCQGYFLAGTEELIGPIVNLNIHFLLINPEVEAQLPLIEYLPSESRTIEFPSSSVPNGSGAHQ